MDPISSFASAAKPVPWESTAPPPMPAQSDQMSGYDKLVNAVPGNSAAAPPTPVQTGLIAEFDKVAKPVPWEQTSAPAQPSVNLPEPVKNAVNAGIQGVTAASGAAKAAELPVLKGAASLADTAYGIVPGVLGGATYAISRALGNSPETSEQSASTLSGAIDKPFGKAFGITNDPAYQNEASNRVMQFIGQNVAKGSDWISTHTGLPKTDVENMIQSLTMAVPAVGGKVLGAVGAPVIDALRSASDRVGAYKAGIEDKLAEPEAGATAQEAPLSYPSQYASTGAASSGLMARLNVATPELQADAQAIFKEAQETYGTDWQNHVDWNAVDRQLNADSLPVPGRLTHGQASGNGALISEEWNKRSTNGLGPIFGAQNTNQIDNLKAIREQSTPDVYTNTPAEHADTLIKAYKDLGATDQKVIDDKWTAIRAQSGDRPIFDANQMLADSQAALKKNLLSSQDPDGQLAELMTAARERGGLSADGYNAFRQNLGKVAMKGGNEGKAAGLIIDATNKSTVLPEAAQFRGMVNDALASGRALHQKLALDPAYKAVVDGDASVKDFSNKFIINGKPENVAQMSNNLAGNNVANQTMRAVYLDNLRTAAALDEQYNGNFAAKSFNKQLSYVAPGARAVFHNGELQTLGNLGDYSRHISADGRDSWKNYSNTATELNTPTHAMGSKLGSVAMGAAEAALAHHTMGASIPIVSVLRSGIEQRAAVKAAIEEEEKASQYVHESTRPAAGFINPSTTQPKTVPKRASGGRVLDASTASDVERAGRQTDHGATGAQKHADNYKKGRFRFSDGPLSELGEIAIETAKGRTRTAHDGSWRVHNMPAHYGHLMLTDGNDGDKADVFIGGDLKARKVYIIDQINLKTGKFDETKSMLCFPSEHAARRAYVKSFSDGNGDERLGNITAMSPEQFAKRAKAHRLRAPASVTSSNAPIKREVYV